MDEKKLIRNASLWIQLHCCEKLQIEEVAEKYKMSKATFYRAWKRCFDIPPLQYSLDLRLQAAAKLLLESPFPISRISRDSGFGGVDSFHSKFKQKFGVTPAEYRRSHRKNIT